MATASEALRAVSDTLLRDLEVLARLEEEKRTIEPGDPRLVDLADRVQALAREVLSTTVRQAELAEAADAEVEAGAVAARLPSVNETPRAPVAILADWRDAVRRLAAAEPGSAEWIEANALSKVCREEYRRALDEAGGQ
jgi:hypothetical protein